MARNNEDFQRRRPRQARSRVTYDSILQAAIQVLARDGAAGLTTNRVAERAGVSIGTLYQYFPDKAAILVAAAQQELAKADPGLHASQRNLVEALIKVVEALLHRGDAAHRGRAARRSHRSAKPLSRGSHESRALIWLISPAWLAHA